MNRPNLPSALAELIPRATESNTIAKKRMKAQEIMEGRGPVRDGGRCLFRKLHVQCFVVWGIMSYGDA